MRPGGAPGAATQALAQQGWRAVSFGPRDRLDAVWQELAHTSAQSARGTAGRREVPEGIPAQLPAEAPAEGVP